VAKTIAVIAPHPDDAELGVGGYIHREVENEQAHVEVFVLARGSKASSKSMAYPHAWEDRETECTRACNWLGVKSVRFLHAASDGNFAQHPMSDLVKVIEGIIFQQTWDELFIPLPSFHSDHQITYVAALAALRPHLQRQYPARVYAYEYPGNVWGVLPPANGKVYAVLYPPNLEAKLKSISEHKSQWASNPDSLWGDRGIKALAELRGVEANVQQAECFYLLRQVV